MDFSWNDEEQRLYEETFKFARSLNVKMRTGFLDRAAWRQAGQFGLLGICVPEEYQGMGRTALSTARLMEAFGHGCADSGFVFSAAAHLFACAMPVVEHASGPIKQYVVPKLVDGTWIGANAITESEAGSDVFSLRCSAREDGDEFVLNGEKTYVTNGPCADVFVVYATINPAFRHLGVTAFLVPGDVAGLTRGNPFQKMGLEGAPLSSVYFEDVRVPRTALLGRPGQGAAIFGHSMAWERACLFGMYTGLMERQIDKCIGHANSRRQAGKVIGRHQAVAHRLVEMKMRLESARMLLYRGCWALDRAREGGEDPLIHVCLSKLAVSEAAVATALDAIRIFGGSGIIREMEIEHTLRDAVPSTIFSGTSDIQRNLVAHCMGVGE